MTYVYPLLHCYIHNAMPQLKNSSQLTAHSKHTSKQLHQSQARCICLHFSICAFRSFCLTRSELLVTVCSPRQCVISLYTFCKVLSNWNVYYMSLAHKNSCKDFPSFFVTKPHPVNVRKIIRVYINVDYRSIWTFTLLLPFCPPSVQQPTHSVPTTCLLKTDVSFQFALSKFAHNNPAWKKAE